MPKKRNKIKRPCLSVSRKMWFRVEKASNNFMRFKKLYRIKAITYGHLTHRHNIYLNALPPEKQIYLFRTRFLRYFKADVQVFQLMFKVMDYREALATEKKECWNSYKDKFTTYDEFYHDANSLDWNCAMCGVKIRTEMGKKLIGNYVCDVCLREYGEASLKLNKTVIKSISKFTNASKAHLLSKQKEFISFTKKNSQIL